MDGADRRPHVKFVERLLVTDNVADLQLYTGPNRYAWYSGI